MDVLNDVSAQIALATDPMLIIDVRRKALARVCGLAESFWNYRRFDGLDQMSVLEIIRVEGELRDEALVTARAICTVFVDHRDVMYHTIKQSQTSLKPILELLEIEDARVPVLMLLWVLSRDPDNKLFFASPEFGLVAVLVNLIRVSRDDARIKALNLLWSMANQSHNQVLFTSPQLGLVASLADTIREDKGEPRTWALGVLWRLSESAENVGVLVVSMVFIEIALLIKSTPGYPNIANSGNSLEFHCLMCTYAMAAHEGSRSHLKQCGILEVLLPMMQYDSLFGLLASLSYIFLVGKVEESGVSSELNRPGIRIIDRVVDMLDNVIEGRDGLEYNNGVFKLLPAVRAMAELSLCDANKSTLAASRVRNLLIRVVSDVKHPTLVNNKVMGHDYRLRCAELACRSLLQLSFMNEDNDVLLSDQGFIPASTNMRAQLEEFTQYISSDGSGPADLLLRRLSKTSPSPPSSAESRPGLNLGGSSHVAISYSWHKRARPELVKSLAAGLRSLGYEVWRDVDGSALVPAMSSGLVDACTVEALEQSEYLIVCVSREYSLSSNCRMEASYAATLANKGRLKLIFVMMQEDYTTQSAPHVFDGHLGHMIGAASSSWLLMSCEGQVWPTVLAIGQQLSSNCRQDHGFITAPSSPTRKTDFFPAEVEVMKHDRDEEVAEERHDVGRGYDVHVSGVELESTLVNMERRVGAIEMQLQRLLETNHTLAHANKSLSRALVERKIEGLRDRNKEDDLGVRNTQVLGERNMGNLHSIEGGQQRDSGGLFSMFRSRAWSK